MLLFSLEFVLILGILYFVFLLKFIYREGLDNYWLFNSQSCIVECLVIVFISQSCMYLNELYDYKVSRSPREFYIRLLESMGFVCIILGILSFLFKGVFKEQTNFLIALPIIFTAIFGSRLLYRKLLRAEALAEKVMIMGNAKIANEIISEIAEVKDSGYEIAAFASKNEGELPDTPLPIDNIVPIENFVEEAERIGIDRIVIAKADRRGGLPIGELLDCRFKGIQVQEATSFYEDLTGKIMVKDLRPSWFIFSEGFRKSKFTLKLKRVSDIVMSLSILIAASPVMLITALLIKLDSKGPLIYKQDRVGEGWKDYTLYKFRSMVEDAEAMGVKWAEKDDPRVTRVGRVIRKYRIDEFPQLFNVLRGNMSVVGPRPERRHFIKDHAREIPFYPQRLFVKPGVTGWAQVKYHYGASKNEAQEKLQYDLYYIKHMSFLFDLSIIFDTIRVVLSGAGSR